MEYERKSGILWTQQMLYDFRRFYPTTPTEELVEMFGVDKVRIEWRAKQEGLKKVREKAPSKPKAKARSRAKLTPEQRSESARRAWQTRRANGNAPKPKPPKPKPPKRLLTPEERSKAVQRGWIKRHENGRQKPRMQRCTCRHINSAKMR